MEERVVGRRFGKGEGGSEENEEGQKNWVAERGRKGIQRRKGAEWWVKIIGNRKRVD